MGILTMLTDDELRAIEERIENHNCDLACVDGCIVDALIAEVKRLRVEIVVSDKLIEDRNRVLDVVACVIHGRCVPHALEEIARLRKLAQSFRDMCGRRPSEPLTGWTANFLLREDLNEKWAEHEAVMRAMDACGGFEGLLLRLQKQCDLNAAAVISDDTKFEFWRKAAHHLMALRSGLGIEPK